MTLTDSEEFLLREIILAFWNNPDLEDALELDAEGDEILNLVAERLLKESE